MTRAFEPAMVETEAKFDVLERKAARALLGAADLAGLPGIGAPRTVRELDQYLDTADGRLRRAGWAARLRVTDGDSRIQLKRLAAPEAAGVQRRTELDGAGGPIGDPSSWPRSAARRRLLQLLAGAPAEPTVTLRQDRLVRDFGEYGGRVELSLDRIAVIAADAVAGRLTLLELEQRDAPVAEFERVAAALRILPYLSASTGTKLGWATAVVAHRRRVDALPVIGDEDAPLRADDPTAEVGRRIMRAQLRRLVERERAFLVSAGPEEIRRMRVATRRLRATWRAFGGAYGGRTPDRLRRRLSRLADALSAVRDLDVLSSRLDAHLAGPNEQAPDALAGLTAAVATRRAAALQSLERELASPRHGQWLDDFLTFVETPGRGTIQAKPPAPRLLREQVGGWIWSGFERVLAWESLVGVADALTLHDLRLETKRLRDVIQVTAPMALAPVEPVVAALVRLQDALGALNDATVTAGVARGYLDSTPAGLDPDEIRAIERFAASQERAAERLRRRIPWAWRTATSPASRRRVARLIGSF